MKVVIIGGGVAGLAMGIMLHQRNYDIVICERANGLPNKGHAFLMHSDGVESLNELKKGVDISLKAQMIDEYMMHTPEGERVKHLKLDGWYCVKRKSLIGFLYALMPAEKIKDQRNFSHFVYEEGKVIAAVFLNGDVEYGDVFIGADGGNSLVREYLFGRTKYTPVEVKEIIGVCSRKATAKKPKGTFKKFQDKESGIAFGLIPTSATDFVWFMQFDPTIADLTNSTAEETYSFCYNLLRDYPQAVKDTLQATDFNNTYTWHTRDFDLLPSFHKGNVVLIGDAAHLALPFTSAGTTNAIVDAQTLVKCMDETIDVETAFTKYYDLRKKDVSEHVQLGRQLKKIFLKPETQTEEIPVPLINMGEKEQTEEKKLINILYFTDPICSTCWIIQPMLRRMQLEYGKFVNIEYRMGGLLPSWEGYSSSKIKSPDDAAKHWEEVCEQSEMPLDGDIWKEDPLSSSYPPSIAFKAAQLQDQEKAIQFLRRMKEMVFVEKKNIIRWEFLEKAALYSGLDVARLKRDIEGQAKEKFSEDISMARELGVTGFPTLFFTNCSEKKFVIKGFQQYEKFEEVLKDLIPTITKERIDTNPYSLFQEFPSMTIKEFSFLANVSKEEATTILENLYTKNLVQKYQGKNGAIYQSNLIKCDC